MTDYYTQKLSAERLRQVYEIAPPRVQQYLEVEIELVLSKIKPIDTVLELGCGYGRVLQKLIENAKTVVGIDTSMKWMNRVCSMRLVSVKIPSSKNVLPPTRPAKFFIEFILIFHYI